MEQSMGGSLQHGITFRSSNINAGNDININPIVHNVSNVTINNSSESSLLTRLKTALGPVTSANYDSYEAKRRSECFPNTRIQVLDNIEAWIHAESHQVPIYVLDGVAGIGKSTIAQTIAVRAAAMGLLGASFFFSRDEDLRKIARHFFPTIAYQLACYDNRFATSISRALEQTPDAPAKRLDQQMTVLWLEPLELLLSQKTTPTLLVVDALDECEEDNTEELLSLLGKHIHRMKGLKILVTMRPEAHLRDILDQDKRHERFRLHEIEDSIVHSDIRLYLQSQLSTKEISKVSRNRRTSWQPTEKDIDMLCEVCGTLFIIAATATKFILDRKRLNPEKQLARLLDGISTSGPSGTAHTHILDEAYVRIILAGRSDMDDNDDDWFRDLNKVLGTLIALANPLPCNALASLLEMSWEDVEVTLSPLHSLVAPSGSGEIMIFRIHHKSFPDFITNRERIQHVLNGRNSSKRQSLKTLLWVDIGYQHLQLAKACLRIMTCELKWNMKGVNARDWYEDKDSSNRSHVPPHIISPDLVYASLHWASHLRSADRFDKDLDLKNYVEAWASKHILAWMEVMVMLNQVNEIYGILEDAIDSLQCITDSAWTERAKVRELLSDACRFVQQGSEIMRLSPMHIYRSCLPFTPTDTALSRTYHGMSMFQMSYGTSPRWDPLFATLMGHSAIVTSVSFSSDGCQLASGSWDQTIRLWDAKTGAHLSTLDGHSDWVESVAFSNDDSQLASGSDDGTIRLWDAKTGALVLIIANLPGSVLSVTFTGDGSRLASGSSSSDNTLQFWDAKTGAHVYTLAGHSSSVSSVAFSKYCSRLASGSRDTTIQLWDVNTGVHVFTLAGHSATVNSVAFCNNDSHLASGSTDKTIRLWDANTGTHVSTLTGHMDSINSVAFSSDDCRLASGSNDKTIRIWDPKTGVHISTLTGHSGAVNSVAFSNDGARLASASWDSTVRLWDPKQATHSSDPIGHRERFRSLAFSNDGSLLASASEDKTIRLLDVDTRAYKYTLDGHLGSVNSITFSNDGSRLVSGSDDETVRLWSVRTGAHTHTLSGHLGPVTSVAISSDDSQLASGSHDKTVRLWDVKTGACISSLVSHTDWVLSVAFASDDSLLASAAYDHTVRLWDTKTEAHMFTLYGHSLWPGSVTFCSGDLLLVTGFHDGTIGFEDAKTGMHIYTLTSPLISKVISLLPLRGDSKMVNQLGLGSAGQSFDQNNRIHILALVERNHPPITGLVLASSRSKVADNMEWEVSVVCWFPPDMAAASFTVDHDSKVAVGCKSGRVLILDFSSDSPLLNS